MKKYLAFALTLFLLFPFTISAKKTDLNESSCDLVFDNENNNEHNNNHEHNDFDNTDLYFIIPLSFECCLNSTTLYIEKKYDNENSYKEIIEKFYEQHVCYEQNDEEIYIEDCSEHNHTEINIKEINIDILKNITQNSVNMEHLFEELPSDISSESRWPCNPCKPEYLKIVSTNQHVNGACSNYCYSYTVTTVRECTLCKSLYNSTGTTGIYHTFVYTGSSYSFQDCTPMHTATFHNIIITKYYVCNNSSYYCSYPKTVSNISGQVYCYGY